MYLQYLRNILYKYMLGTETKVIYGLPYVIGQTIYIFILSFVYGRPM